MIIKSAEVPSYWAGVISMECGISLSSPNSNLVSCILFSANTFGKGWNLSLLPPKMD